jgi:hypothetical protein
LWIIAACILVPCCGLVIGGGIFMFKMFNEAMPFVGCLGAMESVGQAIDQYVAAHNGKLPNGATWQDDLKPYYEQTRGKGEMAEFNKMGADQAWGCWGEGGKPITGFAFNSDLSGKPVKDIKEPDQNPVVFEVPEIKKNNAQKYVLRDFDQSPKIVLGQRRGWLELDSRGQMYMLIRSKGGAHRRTPINVRGGSSFDVNDESGIEVKEPGSKQ